MAVTFVADTESAAITVAIEQAAQIGWRAVYRSEDSGVFVVVDHPRPPPSGSFTPIGAVAAGKWRWASR